MKTREEINSRIEEIKNQYPSLVKSTEGKVGSIVRGILGNDFHVSYRTGYLNIFFRCGEYKDGTPRYQEIELEGTRNFGDVFEFKTNVSAMGSFSICDTTTREFKYYMAIGKLLSCSEEMEAIREIMMNVYDEIMVLRDEINALRKELDK